MRKYLLGTITGLSMVVGLAYAITTQTFQNPIPVVNGGLATTTAISGLVWGNGTGYTATSTTGSGSVVLQTSPTLVTPNIGSASSTGLTVTGGTYLATSTVTNFTASATSTMATTTVTKFTANTITVPAVVLATSTTMSIDMSTSSNTLVMPIGTAAITVTFANLVAGQQKTIQVINPPTGTAGAITWTGCTYSAGTAPTQTTTAGKYDWWSFKVGVSTTSPYTGTTLSCNQTPNF